MSNLKAKEYRRFEDVKYIRKDGSEYWSSRELVMYLIIISGETFKRHL